MANHRLLSINNTLYFPKGGNARSIDPVETEPSMLIRTYDAGDCDTVPWPLGGEHHHERLRIALYDERETNPFFAYGDTVELPDGTPFEVLA